MGSNKNTNNNFPASLKSNGHFAWQTNNAVIAAMMLTIFFCAAIFCQPALANKAELKYGSPTTTTSPAAAAMPTPSEAGGNGSQDSSSLQGTVTLEIKTTNGSVRVILPDDIRSGDTISGTVIDVVQGQVVDVKTLEGAVVEVGGQKVSVSNGKITFTVPQGLSSIPLVLRSIAGKHIGMVQLTVNSNFSGDIPAQPGRFAPPRLGQAGRDITIPGNFDGNAANTTVNVGVKELPVIAESPRQTVVKIPADTPTGAHNITINENPGSGPGNSQMAPFNVVSLQLTADKTNLLKGEKTSLHISVTGLEGLKDNSGNIKLQVENVSPQIVNLTFSPAFQQSGNVGTLLTRAVDLDGDNTISFNEQLTGVNPGNFQINATVITPLRNLIRELIRKYWEDQLNAIAAMKEAAAKNVKGNSKVPKDLLENAKKLRDLAKNKLWDDEGTSLLDLKKSLQKEKEELNRIQRVIGANSDTGKEIQKIKDALDKMAKGMGIKLDK